MRAFLIFVPMAAFICALAYFGAKASDQHDRNVSQAAYASGQSVGEMVGACRVVLAVADANPSSRWTYLHQNDVRACASIEGKS